MQLPAIVRPRVALSLLVSLACASAVALAAPGHAATAPVPAAVRILPLGDSITYGTSTDLPGGAMPGGYRGTLDGLLESRGIMHRFVGSETTNPSPSLTADNQAHHEGHPGYRVDQVATDLDGLAGGNTDNGGYWLTGTSGRAAIRPDVVIIHLGTNDITHYYDPGVRVRFYTEAARQQFAADLKARLKGLVDKIYALRPYTRIVLSTIVPVEIGDFEAVSYDYAIAVRSLVSQERKAGRRIVLAEMFNRFCLREKGQFVNYPGLVSTDGVHPTPAGYQVMANVYSTAVANVLALS
jgi:lysophospholipase L1-like esterase